MQSDDVGGADVVVVSWIGSRASASSSTKMVSVPPHPQTIWQLTCAGTAPFWVKTRSGFGEPTRETHRWKCCGCSRQGGRHAILTQQQSATRTRTRKTSVGTARRLQTKLVALVTAKKREEDAEYIDQENKQNSTISSPCHDSGQHTPCRGGRLHLLLLRVTSAPPRRPSSSSSSLILPVLPL